MSPEKKHCTAPIWFVRTGQVPAEKIVIQEKQIAWVDKKVFWVKN